MAAPNCRIGVTLLRLLDDDHALRAHAERINCPMLRTTKLLTQFAALLRSDRDCR
jgi:hypothetical protein